MPGKPFTKVLIVVRFQATFIVLYFSYCLNFLHVRLLFYNKETQYGVLRKKERKRKEGREGGREERERKKEREKERKKKNEERKQRRCEADSLLKDGCNLDQPSEFTHLGSET